MRHVQFALYPRDARTPAEHIYADYLAMEGHLRTETGAMNHARVPRKSSPTQPQPSPPISAPATSASASPKHSSILPTDTNQQVKVEAPPQQSPRAVSVTPEPSHVQQILAQASQASRPACASPSGPVDTFRMPASAPQDNPLPASWQKVAGAASAGVASGFPEHATLRHEQPLHFTLVSSERTNTVVLFT